MSDEKNVIDCAELRQRVKAVYEGGGIEDFKKGAGSVLIAEIEKLWRGSLAEVNRINSDLKGGLAAAMGVDPKGNIEFDVQRELNFRKCALADRRGILCQLFDLYSILIAKRAEFFEKELPQAAYFRGNEIGDYLVRRIPPKGKQLDEDGNEIHLPSSIGGTDADTIFMGSPLKKIDLMNKKLAPAEYESPNESWTQWAGPLGRGNAWEMELRLQQMRKFPEEHIAIARYTYQFTDCPELVARFDALMLDANGIPNGVIEFKYANNDDDWGMQAAGIDGIPRKYRYQVLYYFAMGGFSKARVVVIFSNLEQREYNIELTDDLKDEAAIVLAESIKFAKQLRLHRDAGDKFVPRDGAKTMRINPKFINTHCAELEGKKILAVDLETTGSASGGGRVIELGAIAFDQNGKIEYEIGGSNGKFDDSGIFGIPDEILDSYIGEIPFEDTHHIPASLLKGHKEFYGSSESKQLLQMLESGDFIFMAHNASYEFEQLSQYVDGFYEAFTSGKFKIMDTMGFSINYDDQIKTKGNPRWRNNTLDSYAHRWGILADDQSELHRAYDDARIMYEAFIAQKSEFDSTRLF